MIPHSSHTIAAQNVLIVLLGLLFLIPSSAVGQRRKRAPSDAPVFLEHADHVIYDQFEHPDAQRLSGRVAFRHAGMRMVCDSAVYFQSTKSFEAFGRVRITEGDTLSMRGDRLYYDGQRQTSYMKCNKGEVEVRHHQRYLYSDSLFYDAANKFMTYTTGGKLVDGDNVLTSNYGEYYTDTHQAIFRWQVHLTNPKQELVSDELHYNTQTKLAKVKGNSNIFSGDYNIFTTDGSYKTTDDVVELFQRSTLNNPVRQLHMEADRVFYNKQTGMMRATGNVICVDSKNKAILNGEECEYHEDRASATDSSYVTGRALVKDYSNGNDTLFVHADTMRLFSYHVRTDSMYRLVKGYHHVRAYRTDVQAVGDSLIYNNKVSCISLYRDPIVWADNRQVLGEEIHVFTNDSTVDSVYVREQALMVERLDSVHYNQLSGRLMRAYFRDGEMVRGAADGNACMIAFPLEKDSTILYHNYMESAKMRMQMENRKLKRFVGFPSPTAECFPLGMAPPERTYLPSFAWFDYIRPQSQYDLFDWRPKKSDKVLRTTPRRQTPLQHLSQFTQQQKKEQVPSSHE